MGEGQFKCEEVTMPFGKHSDKTMRDILITDPGYLDWLMGITLTNPVLKRAVTEMNRKYAPEINRALRD